MIRIRRSGRRKGGALPRPSLLSGLRLSGLRTRLLLLVLLAVVPALALVLYAALEERRDEAAHAAEETRRLAGLVGAGLARTLETTGQLLLTLGQLRELEGDDPTQCRAVLTRVLGLHPQYAMLAAVRPNGEVFCSTASLGRPPNVADRPHFRRALESGRLAVGRYQVAPLSGRLVLPLVQPVVDGTGRVRAVVFAGLGLEYLGVLAGEARLPWGAELVVADGEGGLLGRYPDPERWVGRAVAGTPLGAAVLSAAGAAQVAGLDGVARLYGLASLRATGEAGTIRVAVGLPGEAVYAQATRHLVRDLVGLAVVALLALGVTWVASDLLLLRPVNALGVAAGRLAAGDLEARTGLDHRPGELGQLAGSFDDMAAALERRTAEAKRAEGALRRSAERLEILHRIDRAILRADSPATIAEGVLGHVRALVGCGWASLTLFDVNTGTTTRLAADAEAGRALQPGIRGSVAPQGIDELREGRAHAVEDVLAVGDPVPNLRLLRDEGLRAYVCVPLLAGGELLGSLNLGKDRPGPFAPEQVEIAREVADQLAVAIQQGRLRETVERHARELERRVDERTAELREANDQLDAFAHSVSHDLRAPLRAMEGFSRALLEDYGERLDPEGRDYARRVLQGAHRLDELIQDLLVYSRIGRVGLDLQPLPLAAVVSSALAQLDGEVRKQGAEVSVEAPLPEVTGHRATLVQVVAHLLGNAVKFVAPGVAPRVRVRAEAREGSVRLWVEDNGIGIPLEHHERVFRVFERLHGIEAYPGTGVGLAIVRRAVARMGGRVGLESAPGRGSAFWIELPSANGEVQ